MKIAQVAPLHESVPPKYYGGTERVVAYLTEALVLLGHDVTLYASGDSVTSAKLVPICERSMRLNGNPTSTVYSILTLEKVFHDAREFDVIHFHTDFLHFPLSRRMPVRQVTTLHGRQDLPELIPIYSEFWDMPLVSISNHQRVPVPWANWIGTVYHGLPQDLYRFSGRSKGYLAFLGRISPEKRLDIAIEVALKAGMPLKIAAKVDPVDEEYFQTHIRNLFDHPLIEYIGEIGENEKREFLGNALCLLFPIDWPEPFGLVMIEAMACGTPVIARKRGSVPEVLDEGVTGFVCETVEEMVAAVEKIGQLDRDHIRAVFDERFAAKRMASDYLYLYSDVMRMDFNVA